MARAREGTRAEEKRGEGEASEESGRVHHCTPQLDREFTSGLGYKLFDVVSPATTSTTVQHFHFILF